MPESRLLRILTRLRAGAKDELAPARLCQVSAEILAMDGAGIMLMSGDVPQGSVCSSNDVSALIEELQYTLGEGPCVDAYEQDRPVIEADLRSPVVPRWSAFTPSILDAGARAVFGFPLHVGSVRLGALNLYREEPGDLTDDQHADALVMAGVAARAILETQATADAGALGSALELGANLQLIVQQAAGMVSAQLEVSITEALVRLRAFAFAHQRTVAEVAEDVVNRTLRLDQ